MCSYAVSVLSFILHVWSAVFQMKVRKKRSKRRRRRRRRRRTRFLVCNNKCIQMYPIYSMVSYLPFPFRVAARDACFLAATRCSGSGTARSEKLHDSELITYRIRYVFGSCFHFPLCYLTVCLLTSRQRLLKDAPPRKLTAHQVCP